MTGARVRQGNAADVEAVVALERATELAAHWTRSAYEAILDADAAQRRCLFVAEVEGTVVGFAVGAVQAGLQLNGCVAEIESVAVAVAARRTGIGRELCGAVVGWFKAQGAGEVVLEVRAGSAGAIALYVGMGFVPAGMRPRYYTSPEEDAVLMRMQLK
jgi:ribosomal-protein-alanine N-acetyltransferase